MLKERSFYNINNSYLFWEREKLFSQHPSMSCYKEKKQRCLANRLKSIKSWISHFLPIEPNFPGKIFPKNPDRLRDSEGPPLLRIRTKVGGWKARRQCSPRKKETLLVGLGSHCWGQPLDPRNRQGCRLECSISSESFDGVIGGRFHFVFVSGQCFPRNLLCWKIAKQLEPWDGSSVRLKTRAKVYWGQRQLQPWARLFQCSCFRLSRTSRVTSSSIRCLCYQAA